MKTLRVGVGFAAMLVVSLALSGAELKIERQYEKSFRGSLGDIPVLVLRGSDGERGEAHGYLCAREILKLVNEYYTLLSMMGGRTTYDEKIRPLVREFRWEDRYREELAGLMRGLIKALPDQKDRLLKSAMREIDLTDLMAGNTLADWADWGCSSFSVWGGATPDGEVVTGRNLDYMACPAMLNAQCIMVIVPEEKYRRATIGISYFGLIGALTALNEDGVFLAIHDVQTLGNGNRHFGFTPRGLALRDALERAAGETAVSDVARVLRTNQVMVGNNIHVSRPITRASNSPVAAVLEWDAADKDSGVTVRPGVEQAGEGRLVCTNHYRQRRSDPEQMKCDRYRRLLEAIDAKTRAGAKVSTLEDARAILSVAMNGMTLHSVVIWPAKRRLAVAFSKAVGQSAGQFPWTEFAWEDILPTP